MGTDWLGAPGQVVQLRHALGLDLPLDVQYGHYLWLAHGDFGQSFKFQAPVRRVVFFERYPATCSSLLSCCRRVCYQNDW